MTSFWIKGYRRPLLESRPGVLRVQVAPKRPHHYRRPQQRPQKRPQPLLVTPETIDTSEAANIDNDNRRHYDVAARGESTSLMRSMLGVNPFCVHEDAQFSCTFTPLCWMHGGVAMSGCDSMLYSCCVSHTIARRQVSAIFLKVTN